MYTGTDQSEFSSRAQTSSSLRHNGQGQPGGIERRGSPRLPIDLATTIECSSGIQLSAQIENYCLTGVFLRLTTAHDGNDQRMLAKQREIALRFSTTRREKRVLFVVRARVARAVDGGIGAEFIAPDPQAVDALYQEALLWRSSQAQKHPNEPIPGANKLLVGVFTGTCIKAQQALTTSLQDVFARACTRLKDSDAASYSLSSETTHSLADLKLLERMVPRSVLHSVTQSFDRLWAPGLEDEVAERVTKSSERLSLVDNESFDDWLFVTSIVKRCPRALQKSQRILEQRLTGLVGRQIGDHDNPIGFPRLCYHFLDSLQNLAAGGSSSATRYTQALKKSSGLRSRLYTQNSTAILKTMASSPSLSVEARNAWTPWLPSRRSTTRRERATAIEETALKPTHP